MIRRRRPACRSRPGQGLLNLLAALAVVAALTSCASTSAPNAAASESSSRPSPPTKVLVIAEENHTYHGVFGQGRAPYLTRLAATYGTLTGMDAGYPARCPSLPAYLLMTSGSTHHICDDAGPDTHPVTGPSIFTQVEAANLEWRGYAESMPAPCTRQDIGTYLVRHAPAPYYTQAASRCNLWDLPMGDTAAGALHDDLVAGSLPAYAFATPDACDDMHGAPGCPADLVAAGDQWLSRWIPQILDAPDYRAGRLVIVITWDEGSTISNRIPTVVVAPSARGVRVTTSVTHCGLLAMEEQVLRLPLLGCAQTASSPAGALGLEG